MRKTFRKIVAFLSILLILYSDIMQTLGYDICLEEQSEAADTINEETLSDGGYLFLPEDFNAPAINKNTGLFAYASLDEESYIPEIEELPPVRNQNPYGTCWAFSTISLAEISILKQEGIALDLSELHLAYFTYDSTSDPLGGLNDENEYIGTTDSYLNKGGNYLLAYHSLANWKGASLEATVPYSQAADSVSNGIDTSLAFDSVAHLRNVYSINIVENPEEVKNMIKQYGAVGVSYYDDSSDYSYAYNSYYSADISGGGHAVSIVGWDDTFPKENFNTQAPGDGAWLIRNSWGVNDYSRYGYFWMSYYNESLIDTAYAMDFVSSSSDEYYDNNYQYDGTIYSDIYSINSGSKIANAFTTKNENEELEAVSFELFSTNVDYEVNIYKDIVDGNPESGTLVSSQAGSTVYAGVYNVKLESPVQLSKDDKYSVVITLNSTASTVKYAADGKWTEEIGLLRWERVMWGKAIINILWQAGVISVVFWIVIFASKHILIH